MASYFADPDKKTDWKQHNKKKDGPGSKPIWNMGLSSLKYK